MLGMPRIVGSRLCSFVCRNLHLSIHLLEAKLDNGERVHHGRNNVGLLFCATNDIELFLLLESIHFDSHRVKLTVTFSLTLKAPLVEFVWRRRHRARGAS